jgi:hypothetical protein
MEAALLHVILVNVEVNVVDIRCYNLVVSFTLMYTYIRQAVAVVVVVLIEEVSDVKGPRCCWLKYP